MKSLALALSSLIILPAHAALNSADFFGEHLACYAREYSASHLRRNPLQTVEKIKITLSQTDFDGTSDVTDILNIQVKRKNETRTWQNTIACNENKENGTIFCGVECDGGSVEILSREANGSIKLRNNGVLLYGGCGEVDEKGNEVDTIYLEAQRGGDDVFVIPARESSACDDVVNTWKKD